MVVRMESEAEAMLRVLHQRVQVLPRGKIEIVDPHLEAGEQADVMISPVQERSPRSAWQVISEGPGHRLLTDAEHIGSYLAEERSWER